VALCARAAPLAMPSIAAVNIKVFFMGFLAV